MQDLAELMLTYFDQSTPEVQERLKSILVKEQPTPDDYTYILAWSEAIEHQEEKLLQEEEALLQELEQEETEQTTKLQTMEQSIVTINEKLVQYFVELAKQEQQGMDQDQIDRIRSSLLK